MAQPERNAEKCFSRYQTLQRYVEWAEEDARCVHSSFDLVRPSFVELIDDFYDEITRHPEAHRVITGVGISRESLAKIMQPLYSTKARGLGLGLAITRAIIEKHHGQLLVTSDEGQGSTFTVRLPAADVPAMPK